MTYDDETYEKISMGRGRLLPPDPQTVCPTCGGTGKLSVSTTASTRAGDWRFCYNCGGTGQVFVEETHTDACMKLYEETAGCLCICPALGTGRVKGQISSEPCYDELCLKEHDYFLCHKTDRVTLTAAPKPQSSTAETNTRHNQTTADEKGDKSSTAETEPDFRQILSDLISGKPGDKFFDDDARLIDEVGLREAILEAAERHYRTKEDSHEKR